MLSLCNAHHSYILIPFFVNPQVLRPSAALSISQNPRQAFPLRLLQNSVRKAPRVEEK